MTVGGNHSPQSGAGRLGRYAQLIRKEGPWRAMGRAATRVGERLAVGARQAQRRALRGWRARQRVPLDVRGRGFRDLAGYLSFLASSDADPTMWPCADRATWAAAMRERLPRHTSEIVAAADQVCAHRFSLLGRELVFGKVIDWHIDADTGARWPEEDVDRIDTWIWSPQRQSDIRPTWELNRHQHLAILGQAYWLTDDERYPAEAAKQIESWIAQNPLGYGINWYSGLEIGLRLMSWVIALAYFRGSAVFMQGVGEALLRSIYQQADYLAGHLTLSGVPNNHVLGETAALVLVGSVLSGLRGSQAWVHGGLEVMQRELAKQISPEGANREQGIGYHAFVIDWVMIIETLSRQGLVERPQGLSDQLERMLEYALLTLAPNGDVVPLGDGDDAVGIMLSRAVGGVHASEQLAVGARLYRRPDFQRASGGITEYGLMLLGPAALADIGQLPDGPPPQGGVSHVDVGHYIWRDGADATGDLLFFKAGPFGYGGERACAHAHCDLLSVQLWLHGRPILVDPGTYSYAHQWRHVFRATMAHNTLQVNGVEQASPNDDFSWTNVPAAESAGWQGEGVVGRMAVAPGIWHRREVVRRGRGQWDITDSVEADGEHELRWYFHLAPDLRGQPASSAAGDQRLELLDGSAMPLAALLAPAGVTLEMGTGWHSSRYGMRQRSAVLTASWVGAPGQRQEPFRWTILDLCSKELA